MAHSPLSLKLGERPITLAELMQRYGNRMGAAVRDGDDEWFNTLIALVTQDAAAKWTPSAADIQWLEAMPATDRGVLAATLIGSLATILASAAVERGGDGNVIRHG